MITNNYFASVVKVLFKEFSDAGMCFFFFKMRSKGRKLDKKEVENSFTNMLDKRAGLIVFSMLFFKDSDEIIILLVKKKVSNNLECERYNVFVNLMHLYGCFYEETFLTIVPKRRFFDIFHELMELLVDYANVSAGIYITDDYAERWFSMGDFLDEVNVFLSYNRKILNNPYALASWAKKYLDSTKMEIEVEDFTKNLVYLDFCYRDLVINNTGIFAVKPGDSYSYVMSSSEYYDTFLRRLSLLKQELRWELITIAFNEVDKERLKVILQNEMDFFRIANNKNN